MYFEWLSAHLSSKKYNFEWLSAHLSSKKYNCCLSTGEPAAVRQACVLQCPVLCWLGSLVCASTHCTYPDFIAWTPHAEDTIKAYDT